MHTHPEVGVGVPGFGVCVARCLFAMAAVLNPKHGGSGEQDLCAAMKPPSVGCTVRPNADSDSRSSADLLGASSQPDPERWAHRSRAGPVPSWGRWAVRC
ncbi:unnamed protein product [Boreogadus saida]